MPGGTLTQFRVFLHTIEHAQLVFGPLCVPIFTTFGPCSCHIDQDYLSTCWFCRGGGCPVRSKSRCCFLNHQGNKRQQCHDRHTQTIASHIRQACELQARVLVVPLEYTHALPPFCAGTAVRNACSCCPPPHDLEQFRVFAKLPLQLIANAKRDAGLDEVSERNARQ